MVDELRSKGAVFVEELSEVPDGAAVIFSAHGIAPAVLAEAESRGLKAIDATCPLVTKVHMEAVSFAKKDATIFLIGHGNHDETIGTLGYAPENMRLIETPEDAEKASPKDPENVGLLTQTTLSLDDTKEIVDVLRRRFPAIQSPSKDDICYATQNRQNAVKALAPKVDVLLILGAENSSNSLRLREVGERLGVPSYLIARAVDIREEWLAGAERLGLTSAASTPESLVKETIGYCRDKFGVDKIEEVETVEENVVFPLPKEFAESIQNRG